MLRAKGMSTRRLVCIAIGLIAASPAFAAEGVGESDVVIGTDGTWEKPETLSEDYTVAVPVPEVSTQVARSLTSSAADDGDLESFNNSGWRMGAVYLHGGRQSELRSEFNMGEVISAWGYQFQFQRGQVGSTVGLVDVVPMLLGLDESMLIPTLNVLVGMRTPGNFEFGLGPHFSPRAPELQKFFDDDVHVEGLGLCAALGWCRQTPGGVNVSINLSAMWAGDLAAYGITLGWNMPK